MPEITYEEIDAEINKERSEKPKNEDAEAATREEIL